MSGRRGRVILVGAGPGAPDLITLRGASALRSADAVVYDALAAEALLDLAPAGALRINVGKRGHDAPTRTQEEILALLLRLANEGRTVVRLKGGDPFVFGRGGEEVSALARAGVPFEVVPGVSSAVGALAYAGIPLTDRRHSASFAVVTGHKDPTKVAAETRWKELASAADTVVVLMGMRNLSGIVERLMAGGLSPATPAACIMDATLATQRSVEAPLGELAERVEAAGLSAPAVVVVGDVVKLRSELRWFEEGALAGRRVLVTRPADQADEMLEALARAGAEPVLVPMIRIAPPDDWAPADAALARLESYDVLLFTSANSVRALAERAAQRGQGLAERVAEVACVGPKTAEAARAAGLRVDLVPDAEFDAEGLAAALARRGPLAGRRLLWPRAAAGRDVLAAAIRAAGGSVEDVAVYRNAPAEVDAAALRRRLLAGDLDALTFASPSAVRNFLALLDDESLGAAGRCTVAAIGPVTAEALRVGGLPAQVVPERAGGRELVAALAAAFRTGGRST